MRRKLQRWMHRRKAPTRSVLVKDVVVLQVKLLFSGLRDLLLMPLSLVAGLAGMLPSDKGVGTLFYDLLRSGRRSERWINLFGAAERVHPPWDEHDVLPDDDIDELVSRLELYLQDKDRYEVTGDLRERLGDLISGISRKP